MKLLNIGNRLLALIILIFLNLTPLYGEGGEEWTTVRNNERIMVKCRSFGKYFDNGEELQCSEIILKARQHDYMCMLPKVNRENGKLRTGHGAMFDASRLRNEFEDASIIYNADEMPDLDYAFYLYAKVDEPLRIMVLHSSYFPIDLIARLIIPIPAPENIEQTICWPFGYHDNTFIYKLQ